MNKRLKITIQNNKTTIGDVLQAFEDNNEMILPTDIIVCIEKDPYTIARYNAMNLIFTVKSARNVTRK